MLSRNPYAKEKMSRVLILSHDFVWNHIIKTDRGPNIAVIAKEAITCSIRDIVAEKFNVQHDLIKEIATIISEEDWNQDIAQHAAVKLVIFRGLQISGLDFPKDIYNSKSWMTSVSQQLMQLNNSEDEKKSPLYELFQKASNDLEDHESKQIILARADKQEIQQRAEILLEELTKQYLSAYASSYNQAPEIQKEELENFTAA